MPIIPNPPVPNVVKLVVSGAASGGMVWNNLFHWVYAGGPPSIADCDLLAAAVYNTFVTYFGPLTPVPTTVEKCEAIDLSSSSAAAGEFVASTAGTSTFDKLPANVAALVSKLILARYRGGRPRSYLYIGGDGHLQDESHWSASFVTAFQLAYQNFASSITASVHGSITMAEECCVAYFGHSGPIGSPDYFPGTTKRLVPIVHDIPVNGYTGEAQIASQRGRIGRRA